LQGTETEIYKKKSTKAGFFEIHERLSGDGTNSDTGYPD
jgi:hypothetical protein